MLDSLRPFISRILGSVVAGIATYLYAKTGIQLDDESQAAILGTLMVVFQVVYVLVHRLVDKKVNPGDNASSHLAAVNKQKAQALKAGVTRR